MLAEFGSCQLAPPRRKREVSLSHMGDGTCLPKIYQNTRNGVELKFLAVGSASSKMEILRGDVGWALDAVIQYLEKKTTFYTTCGWRTLSSKNNQVCDHGVEQNFLTFRQQIQKVNPLSLHVYRRSNPTTSMWSAECVFQKHFTTRQRAERELWKSQNSV
jgi:hypothetical protein